MLKRFYISHLGIFYMLFACFMFAVTGAFAKYLSKDMPSIEVVFFRNLIGLFIVIYAIYKFPFKQTGGHFFLLMFRGFVGTVALFAFFYNVAHVNLATAFTFQKTNPIFTAILAAIVFKERLSSLGWFAVFLGFGGILLVIQPNLGINKTDIIGIWSGLGAAIAYTSVKELNKSYGTNIIVLSFMLWGSFLPLICMGLAEFFTYEPLDFLFSKFAMPSWHNVVFILLMGLSGYYFQAFMTKAFAVGKKAGVIAAVSYADVIFTLIIGYFMGDALPNHLALLGILLVVVSGILVVKEK